MEKYFGNKAEQAIAKKNFNLMTTTPVETIEEAITNKVKHLGYDPQDVELDVVYSTVEFDDETVKGVRIVEYTFFENNDEYMFKLMYSDGVFMWNMDNPSGDILYSNDDLTELLG